jgi:hypothetical protein
MIALLRGVDKCGSIGVIEYWRIEKVFFGRTRSTS